MRLFINFFINCLWFVLNTTSMLGSQFILSCLFLLTVRYEITSRSLISLYLNRSFFTSKGKSKFSLYFLLFTVFFHIIECSAGYFGVECSNKCSKNCIETHKCDRFSGKCDNGCKPGWKGDTCNDRKYECC